MKLVANGHRWDGRGDLQAIITLLAEDETPLYEDSVALSKQSSRHRFAQVLLKRFPELKGKDLEAQLLQLLWQAKSQQEEAEEMPAEKPTRESQADKLVRLVEENRLELFHTPTGVAYARVPIEEHWETHRCRSHGFKQWLSRQLYLTEGKTPNSDALNSAIITIEGKAIFDGEEHELYNRVAFHERAFFYDLADKGWRAVRIDSEGWEIVNTPPILFARYYHQKPQVEPICHGNLRQLLDFVNVRDESDALLVMIYVVSSFLPEVPHPILHLFGEKGAAKTTFFKLAGSLIDPSAEELLMFPRDMNELAQKLYHHWVCYFDNLSSLPDWVSDILSRGCTGAGFGKRELYTDEGDIIWKIKRVIGLNGINIVATKPDLLDRCILLALDRIPSQRRREEQQLLAEFEEAKPSILGGVFDTLSMAMRIYPEMQLEDLPRMADFAHWGAAIARALGYRANDFLSAYTANIQSQNFEVLSSSPVASVLLSLVEDKNTWEGTPADLLEELEAKATIMKVKTNVKGWPGAPHVLTKQLKELMSNFREAGIEVDTGGHSQGGKWKRFIRVQKSGSTPHPHNSGNTVGSVVASVSNTEPYLGKPNARPPVSTPEKENHDATELKLTLGNNVALGRPLSEKEHPQIQTDDTIAPDAKLHTSWRERDSVILQSLGLTKEQALGIWDKQGRPIIHLGPGENCHDLAKLLNQREIKTEHVSAIGEWLEKYRAGGQGL